MELAQSYIEYENSIQSTWYYRLPRTTLASAYVLHCLSTIQLQLQKMEQSLKEVSTNSSMLLKNTEDQVQLKQSIVRLAKYNVSTSLIYKYYKKKKLGGFSVQLQVEILIVKY